MELVEEKWYSLSALQHIIHTHPGSPFRTMRTVMLMTLEVRVAQLPRNARRATARRAALIVWREENIPMSKGLRTSY